MHLNKQCERTFSVPENVFALKILNFKLRINNFFGNTHQKRMVAAKLDNSLQKKPVVSRVPDVLHYKL